MTNPGTDRQFFLTRLRAAIAVLATALALLFTILAPASVAAQPVAYTIVHNFMGLTVDIPASIHVHGCPGWPR